MFDLWAFLLQTLTASGVAALLLLLKALFQDKLPPKWQFAVWSVLALMLLLPAGYHGRYVLVHWQVPIEMLKAWCGDFGFTQVYFPLPFVKAIPTTVSGWLFVLYTAGVIFFAAKYMLSYISLRQLLRRGRTVQGERLARIEQIADAHDLKLCRVVEVSDLPSAFVCGILRPVLVIPARAEAKVPAGVTPQPVYAAPAADSEPEMPTPEAVRDDPAQLLRDAKNVIIVPGYGMALAQAQSLVRDLCGKLEKNGAQVRFAIHPVAGRMPGHMNVLLCEVDIPYEQLYEMDDINPDFASCDLAIVVGANDVLNPAARSAEGTPIYGMPVLEVDRAPHVIICNYDRKPGYAGVENPLYTRTQGVTLLLGDAQETLQSLIGSF